MKEQVKAIIENPITAAAGVVIAVGALAVGPNALKSTGDNVAAVTIEAQDGSSDPAIVNQMVTCEDGKGRITIEVDNTPGYTVLEIDRNSSLVGDSEGSTLTVGGLSDGNHQGWWRGPNVNRPDPNITFGFDVNCEPDETTSTSDTSTPETSTSEETSTPEETTTEQPTKTSDTEQTSTEVTSSSDKTTSTDETSSTEKTSTPQTSEGTSVSETTATDTTATIPDTTTQTTKTTTPDKTTKSSTKAPTTPSSTTSASNTSKSEVVVTTSPDSTTAAETHTNSDKTTSHVQTATNKFAPAEATSNVITAAKKTISSWVAPVGSKETAVDYDLNKWLIVGGAVVATGGVAFEISRRHRNGAARKH